MDRLDPSKWHGWVHPLPSGAKARCGGPGLCPQCSQELRETQEPLGKEFEVDWRTIYSR